MVKLGGYVLNNSEPVHYYDKYLPCSCQKTIVQPNKTICMLM